MSRVGSCLIFILILIAIVARTGSGSSLGYDVHWLDGPTMIERNVPSTNKAVDIYCYRGSNKNLLALWQSVKLYVNSSEFSQYIGKNPEDVFAQYTEDSYGWAVVSPFLTKSAGSLYLDLFEPTCMAVSTKEKHSIELQITRVDLWRVSVMLGGVALIMLSRELSGNPVFYYLCGMVLGVTASFMVIVYYFSKLLPKRTLAYGALLGGWTVGMFALQHAWGNVRALLAAYPVYAGWYAALAAAAGLAACYRLGAPRDPRSRNLVMWTLQAVGAFMIYMSSQYSEASTVLAVAAVAARYFPKSLLYRIQAVWRRRFPPTPRLLSNAEYYEQGARETRRALEELRAHCASPHAAPWRTVRALSDAKRFAAFVEGESHLSDEELLDYESYAFSLDRGKSPRARARAPTPSALDISDDDDSHSDDS